MANIGTLTPFSTDAPQTGQEQSVFDANASGTLGDMPKFVDEFNQSIKDINDLSLSEVGYSKSYLDKDYKERLYTGRKNLLINGGFDVWQRGESFYESGYVSDRWNFRKYTDSTETYISRYNGGIRVLSTGATSLNTFNSMLIQYMDVFAYNYIKGKESTISFIIETDKPCSVYIRSFVVLDGVSVNLTLNSIYVYQGKTNVSVPILIEDNGYSSNTEDIIAIQFYTDNLNEDTVYREIQFEIGNVATPFEVLPIAETKTLCRYYFRKSDVETRVNEYSYEMRVTPTTPTETVAPFTYDAEIY